MLPRWYRTLQTRIWLERPGSEGALLSSLETLFSQYRKKIGVACFASNVARLRSIAVAAKKNDRHVALLEDLFGVCMKLLKKMVIY